MAGKRKILVVDDSEINRRILCKILEGEYIVVEAENGKDALHILLEEKGCFSAILLDLMMPVMDGYTFLEIQQSNLQMMDIPVIVTTQKDGDEAEIDVLSRGASDFLTKPYKSDIIKHRLANIIRLRETATFALVVERDHLTGLYNKESFYSRGKQLMDINADVSYDLIVIDLDGFKCVNNLFGMEEGDNLLCHLANTLDPMVVPLGGISCHIGADTFAAILPRQKDCNKEIVDFFVADLSQYPLHIRLQIRFGVYEIIDRTIPIRTMCDCAKLAIDSIKGKYEVYCAYYQDSIGEQIRKEQFITDGMKKALDEGQFQVYYQPQYELTTEKMVGAEALVHWIHPEKGFLSPRDFIPLFEKNGFITDLDQYVWNCVCRDIRNWVDRGHLPIRISVNVSREDIYLPNLDKILLNTVKRHGLTPEHIHLEITETAYTKNPSQLIEVVENLKRLGFIIEMDDFGSGYSSLNMLSELPVDVLKLDMRFLQNQATEENSTDILAFIISLAKWMNLDVIAEGVETVEQVKILRHMDCNYVQGYYYSKPLAEKEFSSLLAQSKITGMSKQLLDLGESKNLDMEKFIVFSGLKRVMLIVDDAEVNRATLSEMFKDIFAIVEAENGVVAMDYLEQNSHLVDMILLKLVMPVMDGFQVMNQITRNEKLHKIPVIVTGQLGEHSEAKAIAMGAADFIAQPYNPQIAMRRVANVMADFRLRILEREKELVKKVEKMERLAQRDVLTGLYNRMELESKVTAYFCGKEDRSGAFVIMDIDNFKLINDSLGHIKGDRALCKVAKILSSCFRQEDIICRMGGDEFAVFIQTDISDLDLEKRMETLCQRMKFSFEGIHISCSAGVCVAPAFGKDYQSLYNNADTALLSAKRFGKNQYQVFGNDIEMPSLMLFRNMDWLLDESSDAVFVCDAATYDLYYLNSVACRMGKRERKDCMGKKCYEVLWGRTEPCDYCAKFDMFSDNFCEHEINPQGTENHYIVKRKIMDWNGKKAAIEYIQDNTARALQNRMVQQELNHEQALVRCIQQLLGAEDIDEALNQVLETLGNYYQGERAFILTGRVKDGCNTETHRWRKEIHGNLPVRNTFDISCLPIWQKAFCEKKTVVVTDIKKLKTICPNEYEYLKKMGIYNGFFRCFDMYNLNHSCIGIYNIKANQQDTELLESVSYFVKNEIGKRINMEQLVQEKERITGVLNTMQGSYMKVKNDEHWTLLDAYDGFFHFIGYIREEFEMMFQNRITSVMLQEDVSVIRNQIKEQLQHGTMVQIENRLVCKDGEIKWISNHAELIEDAKGEQFFDCVFVDITQQKKEQEEIARSEAFFRAAMEHMDLYFWEYDMRTNRCKNSFKTVRDFGMSEYMEDYPECLIAAGFVYPDDVEPYRELHRQLKNGIPSATLEARIIKNGKPHWKRVHYTTVFDQENRPIKAFGTTEDMERETE